VKITIIGFGNIAHALIAYIGSKADVELSVLTSHPYMSDNVVSVDDSQQKGTIRKISDNPEEIIPDSDMILFTVPSHVRRKVMEKLAPFVSEKTILGAFPGIGGFYDEVRDVIGEEVVVFASQRVPFIARIVEKGKTVKATPKEMMQIAVSKEASKVKEVLSYLLDMDIVLLNNFMEVNLTNSNPILHSARLYTLLDNEDYPFQREILFYEEWDDRASEVLLAMDDEFMQLTNKLGLKHIKSLKEHYDINTVEQLTEKMQSIEAFKGIVSPMVHNDGRYVLDTSSRYFQEDIGHDLSYILKVAEENGVNVPVLQKVYSKLRKVMERV